MTILLLLVAKKERERGRALGNLGNLGNLKGLDAVKNKKIEPMFYNCNTFIKY